MTNQPAPTAAVDPAIDPVRDLNAYLDWSRSVWALAPAEESRPTNDNLLVMGFGLAGETGEVLEFFECGPPAQADMKDLSKELGDVFYYWSCICWETGIDPRAAWQSALVPGERLPRDLDAASAVLAAGSPHCSLEMRGLMLSTRNGVVLEQLKKKVRDGTFDETRFTASMGQQVQVWCSVLAALDLKPSHVLGITVAKVEDRISRGVLLGSGNHR